MKDKVQRFEYRKARVRRQLTERAYGRPRLSVHRSLKYL
jgi:ribosomal protein L18